MFDVVMPGPLWESYFDRLSFDRKTIHFSPRYARVQYAVDDDEMMRCAIYDNGDYFVMQPFRLKLLNLKDGGSLIWDMSNLYGYGGPVSNKTGTVAAIMFQDFRKQFDPWLAEHRVVTEWAMLHPQISAAQEQLIGSTSKIERMKDVVAMPVDVEWRGRATRRHAIEKARANGVIVERVAADRKTLSRFFSLYCETMERRNAPDRFRFPARYFGAHFGLMPDNAILIQAKKDDVVYSSAIVLVCGRQTQYQFAGNSGLDGASDLLILEALSIAREHGADVLDLGGGTTNSPDDNLFRYKASFTEGRRSVFFYKRILDQTMYAETCERAQVAADRADFFPAYRGQTQ